MSDPYLAASQRRISDYPRDHAADRPEDPALHFDGRTVTYGDLNLQVRRFARALLATGIRPGDRVAIFAAARPESVVSYLATISIGAIWQGLNLGYTSRELAYVLGDAEPRIVFAAPPEGARETLTTLIDSTGSAGLAAPLVANTAQWDDFLANAESIPEETLDEAIASVDPLDPAMLVYTSGSTGTPKGALIRHAGIVRLALVQSGKWGLDRPTVLCNLPINHIGCVGDLLSVPLIAGGSVVLRESFNPEQVLADIEEFEIGALFQVATQLQRVASLDSFDQRELPSLKLVGWGGSPLPQATMDRFRAKGSNLMATYGLTEATFSVTYTDLDSTDEVLLNTVGRPDPHIDLRILTEDGEWDATATGEVCIKHPATMAGYFGRPRETEEAFTADGWLRTGDIGHLRPDGNLVLVGRVSEMFKSGGYNVYPREIELVIENHPDVEVAAVVPRPDPDFQEVGVAYVQARTGHNPDPETLRTWLRERLAGYKVPKEIIIHDALPLLPVGKIDKQTLKTMARDEAEKTS